MIERLREAFQQATWPTAEGKLAGVTFSAGAVEWDGHSDFDAVVQATDAALYDAKAAGRNRTVTRAFPPDL